MPISIHSARRGKLQKLTEVVKSYENDISRGFRVTQFHRIWHQSNGYIRLSSSN